MRSTGVIAGVAAVTYATATPVDTNRSPTENPPQEPPPSPWYANRQQRRAAERAANKRVVELSNPRRRMYRGRLA